MSRYPAPPIDLKTPSNARAFQAYAKVVGDRPTAAHTIFMAGCGALGVRDPQEIDAELRACLQSAGDQINVLQQELESEKLAQDGMVEELIALRSKVTETGHLTKSLEAADEIIADLKAQLATAEPEVVEEAPAAEPEA